MVLKYRRDWNLRKIFWEFVLTWRAFLRGVSEIPILLGPIIIRKTATGELLSKKPVEDAWIPILRAIAILSKAGIDHRELRHPQYHIVVGDCGKINILDFERGKLTAKPRNISRFVVWLLERGVDGGAIKKELDQMAWAPASDKKGAEIAIYRQKKRKGER